MVASSTGGRVRIRDGELKKAPVAEAVRSTLLEKAGINEVTINRRIGSLLVLFDKAVTSLKQILKALYSYLGIGERREGAQSAPEPTSVKKPSRLSLPKVSVSKRSVVNFTMLASLLASIVGAAVDVMSLHIVAGLLFLGICGLHLVDKRRPMFA